MTSQDMTRRAQIRRRARCPRLARVAAMPLLLAALAMGGCRGQVVPADDLASWQAKPLRPDPNLARSAVDQVVCRSGQPEGFAVRVVLQDRRTVSKAAFLVAGPGFWGSCIVSVPDGNGAGSGRTDDPGPLVGPVVVDERSNGSLGAGSATLLGGRAAPNVATVLIDLPNGGTIEASIGGGFWLAWWPSESEALRIRALDATGAVLATLDDSMPGWQLK